MPARTRRASRRAPAVTPAGSGRDADAGDTLSYAWTQTGGASVAPSGADTATATFTAPGNLTGDATLTFGLKVTDAAGLYYEDAVSVTVVVAEPPEITGPLSFTVVEGDTAVAVLTATDADTNASDLRWSIPAGAAGGTDAGRFTLTSAGVLSFGSGKDFEAPDDADGDGTYRVSVKVSFEGVVEAGHRGAALEQHAQALDERRGPFGEVGERRVAVGDGFDVHGNVGKLYVNQLQHKCA